MPKIKNQLNIKIVDLSLFLFVIIVTLFSDQPLSRSIALACGANSAWQKLKID